MTKVDFCAFKSYSVFTVAEGPLKGKKYCAPYDNPQRAGLEILPDGEYLLTGIDTSCVGAYLEGDQPPCQIGEKFIVGRNAHGEPEIVTD
jgi:hypothetical protein